MRVQTEDWQQFVPGVRMYKGKLTYFYNGEKLYDDETKEFLVYNKEERLKWKVIVVLPGVEIIPQRSFYRCYKVKTVIMSDHVKRIEQWAFSNCHSLTCVRLSKHLEYIGHGAFSDCWSLTSIFIPPSCRQICDGAFTFCYKLIILSVPRNTTVGNSVINRTPLINASHFETNENGFYERAINDEVNEWIKNLNQAEEFALHRECASIEPPSEDNIYEIIKQQGPSSLHIKNEIGLTPLEYLQENPYIENHINQHKLIKRLVLNLTGEIIA